MPALAAYVRVSSHTQIDGYGLQSQEQAIEVWAGQHSHTIAAVFSDGGVSGATDAAVRPALADAIQMIAAGSADGLVVARLDRLARALTVQEATLAMIWRLEGEVYSVETGRVLRDDPDDPMRTALRQVVGVFAELDRRMVVKRLRDGRAAKANAGRKAVGSYPYGFTGAGKGKLRDAAQVPDEQAAIELILDLRRGGLTFRAIALKLNQLATFPPKRSNTWHASTVRNICLRARQQGNGATDSRS